MPRNIVGVAVYWEALHIWMQPTNSDLEIPAGRIKSLANCRWKMEIGADPSNRGNFAVMNVIADHMQNGVLKVTDSNPPGTELSETMSVTNIPSGMFVSFSFSENKVLDNILEDFGMVKELKAVGRGLAVGASEDLKNAVTGLANSLSTTVIMPAGDIFMFKGLNTDPQGNVYSGITYSTPSGGEVTTHGGIEEVEGLTTRSSNTK